jgi:S-adenosylmethionine:tRNA-ribosyltransferase-isomerase (queuine synthetase)
VPNTGDNRWFNYGVFETIIKAIIYAQAGLGAIASRRITNLVIAANQTRGISCTIDSSYGNLIDAIGTTSMRSIETSVSTEGLLKPYDGWTNKFIFPPYDFSIADCMVTNFHTPLSTLLMMISAFCGHDLMMEAYKQAVEEKYKFYSYGDAMLIL